MIARAEHLNGEAETPKDSILNEFEKGLSRYIGILSKFIVQRQYEKIMGGGSLITEEKARIISDSILLEASLLIGNERTEDLRSSFKILLKDHYKEG
jgi:hypothetical protein